MNFINHHYRYLLDVVRHAGDRVVTRNHPTYSNFRLPTIEFQEFPLVTTRKTAWKMAIEEMEWFVSGQDNCPDKLLPWWRGQLNPKGFYLNGYPRQFRKFLCMDKQGDIYTYDQIKFILNGLINNPNSRRPILTSWNPGDMEHITELNENPNTPTSCHNTLTQFFVRDGILHATTYQRSADMLLGVPHNWVQTWALLHYFAFWAGLQVGMLRWNFGDAHVYDEESHLETVNQFLLTRPEPIDVYLVYAPHVQKWDQESLDIPPFLAEDFSISGKIPEPVILNKPKLL